MIVVSILFISVWLWEHEDCCDLVKIHCVPLFMAHETKFKCWAEFK